MSIAVERRGRGFVLGLDGGIEAGADNPGRPFAGLGVLPEEATGRALWLEK
ncbi:hypothetical protein [Streptacidiphilus neutrinimicus]|uniref:hypothetical protein n=1 Tax=Streptacidiphilus neutrinimicus TaxID=105420 RepID=UPI0013776112|nr:hypothetical protein [Streptacidiphilus neutrinimicus]